MKKTKENLVELFKEHSPKKPLSQEMTYFFFNCMMNQNDVLKSPMSTVDKESEVYKHFEPLINEFTVQIFLRRLKSLANLDITMETLIMLCEEFTSPGKAVMYVYYLYMMCPKNSVVDLDKYTELFPMGTFTETQLNNIWDKQKVSTETKPDSQCIGAHDNLIDYMCVWE